MLGTRRSQRFTTRLLLAGAICLSFLLAGPAAAAGPALVRIIDTSAWSPPSPDPAGITYWQGQLVVFDSEVEEIPALFAGANVFYATPAGALAGTTSTLAFTNEPVAVDFDPDTGHFFAADDSDKEIFEIDPGGDGLPFTTDDVVTSFFTNTFGNNDPEGLTIGAIGGQRRMFIVDASGREVYVLDPGPNGTFEGANDDVITHFDTEILGARDTEGIDFHPDTGTLYLADRLRDQVLEITTGGSLVRRLDIEFLDAVDPSDVTLAPGSNDPSETHLYITARGVDNNEDPNENDGKIYEITLGDPPAPDSTPPTVTDQSPSPGATDAPIGTVVQAVFSEDVVGVTGGSFTLEGPAGAVAAGVSYNAATKRATLDPSADLAPTTVYTASLSGAITDIAGNPLAPVSWSFSTESVSDTSPPVVTGRSPAPDASNVSVASNVTATFDEDVTGVDASSFALAPQGGGPALAAAVTYDAGTRTATLDPDADLAAGTTYTANLTGGIADLAGNPLAATSWSFTTAPAADTTPPTVTATSPPDGAVDVEVTANVTATFDEPVSGVTGGSFTLEGPGGAVTAAVSYHSGTRTATLNPTANLTPGATYTARLSGSITDASNNALAPVEWSFTVIADTAAPTVTAVSPQDGATDVDPAAGITATFSEDMSASTINASSVTLLDPSLNNVPVSVSYNASSRTVTIDPDEALTPGATYTASLSGAIADVAGNPLAPFSWSFTIATAPPPSGNLLANSSFELDANNNGKPDHWRERPQFARSNAAVHGGGFSGRFQANNNSSTTVDQRVVGLTAGATYDFSGWLNIPDTNDSFVFRVKVKWLNASNKSLGQATFMTMKKDTNGAWVAIGGSAVAPAGAQNADVQIYANNLKGTIYIDDFSFARR
jgi:hypothetical protein